MAIIRTQNITFGGKELELRLDAKSIIGTERKLRKSLFTLFFVDGKQNIPSTGEMLTLIHGCITTHGVKESDMIDLFDNYMAEGKGPMDLMQLCMEIMEEGGFFGRTEADDTNLDSGLLAMEEPEEAQEAEASLLN